MIVGSRPLPLISGFFTTSEQLFNSDCYTCQSFDTIQNKGTAIDLFIP